MQRTTISYLVRKSEGYNFLQEDVDAVGAEEVMGWITNINECPDGVYELKVVNEKRDWETGMVDEYDYKLVPVPKTKD